jgi:hypothetical protein
MFGQYVNETLSLEQIRSIIDGWLTWPDYGPGYSGPSTKFAWMEGIEGGC